MFNSHIRTAHQRLCWEEDSHVSDDTEGDESFCSSWSQENHKRQEKYILRPQSYTYKEQLIKSTYMCVIYTSHHRGAKLRLLNICYSIISVALAVPQMKVNQGAVHKLDSTVGVLIPNATM